MQPLSTVNKISQQLKTEGGLHAKQPPFQSLKIPSLLSSLLFTSARRYTSDVSEISHCLPTVTHQPLREFISAKDLPPSIHFFKKVPHPTPETVNTIKIKSKNNCFLFKC